MMGLEPTTPGTTIRCSNQLSYTHQAGLIDSSRRKRCVVQACERGSVSTCDTCRGAGHAGLTALGPDGDYREGGEDDGASGNYRTTIGSIVSYLLRDDMVHQEVCDLRT